MLNKRCVFENCDGVVYVGDYCHKHYNKMLYDMPKRDVITSRYNKIIYDGSVAKIGIQDRYGQFIVEALVDSEDVDKIWMFRWSLGANGYICTGRGGSFSKLEHRIFGNPPDGMYVDHINRNPLDNRKVNLRFVTSSQNAQNRGVRGVTSQYRGVYWCKASKKWHSRITVRGFRYHLGYYTEEYDAAKAYNKVALLHYGNNAALNTIP